jgi:rhamnogalacturonan endolyase
MRRILGILLLTMAASAAERQFERLNRGLIATRVDTNIVAISWRLLATDPADVPFDLYRSRAGESAQKLNAAPITRTTFFLDTNAPSATAQTYSVRALVRGSQRSEEFHLPPDSKPYHSIRLQTPWQQAVVQSRRRIQQRCFLQRAGT